jgi:uncharacterized protein YggE
MPNAIRLVMLSFLVMLSSAAWSQCTPNCVDRRTIGVNASATATADADLAIIRVGYRLYGRDARTVYASASETSNAIMQALTGSGVPKSAIESTSQVLQHTPPYELQQVQDNAERARREFTVVQGWVIRTKPEDASKVLNTAINAGANESGWIEWVMEKRNLLEAQASATALANARVIAEQMAQKLTVRLGQLVSANQNQQAWSVNGNGPLASAMGGIIGAMGQSGTQPLAINSRRVECNIMMSAVFAIE